MIEDDPFSAKFILNEHRFAWRNKHSPQNGSLLLLLSTYFTRRGQRDWLPSESDRLAGEGRMLPGLPWEGQSSQRRPWGSGVAGFVLEAKPFPCATWPSFLQQIWVGFSLGLPLLCQFLFHCLLSDRTAGISLRPQHTWSCWSYALSTKAMKRGKPEFQMCVVIGQPLDMFHRIHSVSLLLLTFNTLYLGLQGFASHSMLVSPHLLF